MKGERKIETREDRKEYRINREKGVEKIRNQLYLTGHIPILDRQWWEFKCSVCGRKFNITFGKRGVIPVHRGMSCSSSIIKDIIE